MDSLKTAARTHNSHIYKKHKKTANDQYQKALQEYITAQK